MPKKNIKQPTTKASASSTTTKKPQDNAKATAKAKVKAKINIALLDVLHLLNQSTMHRYLFIADLETMIMPCLYSNQYRLFHVDGKSVGFALWACVSDEAHDRLMQGIIHLKPNEWNSGDNIWLMDIISPGLEDKQGIMLDELCRSVFANKKFMMPDFDQQGNASPKEFFGEDTTTK